jgi:hypothetical protein
MKISTPTTTHLSVQTTANKGRHNNSVKARGKRNIIKTLAIISTAFILCTSWNQWFFFLFNFGVFDYKTLSSIFYHFSVVAMFANCCVNPFIYAAKYDEFRGGLMKIFCKKKASEMLSTTGESYSSHM